MYTVFVNEKPLWFNETPNSAQKNLKYEGVHYFDEVVTQLKNSSIESINIYHHNINQVWDKFQNHFSVITAAGGVVKNQHHQILFIKRFGKWDLPKGKIEPNESIEQTALREVQEECGISNLQLQQFITTTYHIYFTHQPILKVTHWYSMLYNGSQPLIAQTEEAIEQAIWQPQSKIKDLMGNTYQNISLLLKSYQESFPTN